MPELPEVETVKRSLAQHIIGRKILEVDISLERICRVHDDSKNSCPDFRNGIIGRTIEALDRRGKYLLVFLSSGNSLVVHLRMTGRWVYCSHEDKRLPHTHIIFKLDNGYELRYTDVRQFGGMVLVPSRLLLTLPGLSKLGPEPLSNEWDVDYFALQLAGRKTALKTLLLNQQFLAGLGNIYVDEALARSSLHPDREARSLSKEEISNLHQAIQAVLQEGIDSNGTSFRDYVDGTGNKGSFQEKLWVYGKQGKPCIRCGELIVKEKRGGRGTHFCPCCQM